MGKSTHLPMEFIYEEDHLCACRSRSDGSVGCFGCHIRKAGDQYTSRCRSCRKPMVRIAKRNWMLDDRRA